MTKKNKKLWILLPIFLIAELSLWYFILFQSSGQTLRNLCFFSVVLACVFAFCFIQTKRNSVFLNFGLFCTVIADFFLVLPSDLTYTRQVLGVAFFCFVQFFYFGFLFCETQSKRKKLVHGITRLCIIAVALIALFIVLKSETDLLSFLSLFYVANLATNALFAFCQGKKGVLFGIGLVLFLCCDLFVGFSSAIGVYLPVSETSWLYKLVFADFNFIWFFYLPSQTVIGVSLAKYNGYFRK